MPLNRSDTLKSAPNDDVLNSNKLYVQWFNVLCNSSTQNTALKTSALDSYKNKHSEKKLFILYNKTGFSFSLL